MVRMVFAWVVVIDSVAPLRSTSDVVTMSFAVTSASSEFRVMRLSIAAVTVCPDAKAMVFSLCQSYRGGDMHGLSGHVRLDDAVDRSTAGGHGEGLRAGR